jgi:hypothetical protein
LLLLLMLLLDLVCEALVRMGRRGESKRRWVT